MANETTYTTATELIDSEFISRDVDKSLREEIAGLEQCKVQDIGAMPTRTVAWVKNNSLSVTTKSADSDACSNVAYNPTDVTGSVAEYGVKALVTKMALRSATSDISAEISEEIRLALGEQMQTSFCAMFSGFTGGSQNVGTTTANITMLVVLEALKNLRANAKSRAGVKPGFWMHPQQVMDINAEGFTATANMGNSFAREDIQRTYGSGALNKFVGELAGVPLFQDSLIPTANSGADRAGGLICYGAIGCAIKWMPEIDVQPTTNDGINGFAILGTIAYVFAEVQDLLGVAIVTDA